MPGFELENVFLLREPSQANQIAQFAVGKKVVIIGTSFIGEWRKFHGRLYRDVCLSICLPAGMEVAAYLSDKAASVSSIDITAVPFERVLGQPVGKILQEVSRNSTGMGRQF